MAEEKKLDTVDRREFIESWSELDSNQKKEYFHKLSRSDAEELFLNLGTDEQVELLQNLSLSELRSWLRLLPFDDSADFIQAAPYEKRHDLLALLDEQTRREVQGLLAYAEDQAGGLMNPRFIRLRPDMHVEEALRYIRMQVKTAHEPFYYNFVLDPSGKLVGVVSFRAILLASSDSSIKDIMRTEFVSVRENTESEEIALLMQRHGLMSIPVIDQNGVMKGIITYDDIDAAIREEITEDIQKLGGMESLAEPYTKVTFFRMFKKRVGWLMLLFVGQMFTASAMSSFEDEIAKAVILAVFIPLIISSGGNSGSQASTLVIRALALRELRMRDWWKVIYRELGLGFSLGLTLAILGFLRIFIHDQFSTDYGEHAILLGLTVSVSVVGVVMWGCIMGSMLPFVLRKFGLDPASASAPFVATLVDVTGILIYFGVASIILAGSIL